MPYLRIFGPDSVAREHLLEEKRATLGRASGNDVQLEAPAVSRTHATVSRIGNAYELRDMKSTHGTLLNGRRVDRGPLAHGDVVQIDRFVLEFRTDDEAHSAELAHSRTSVLGKLHTNLRQRYRPLPAGMKARYRALSCAPETVFAPGDTLEVGHGGVLLPGDGTDLTGVCIELSLAWPGGRTRSFLAEVMAMLPEESSPDAAGVRPDRLCVKLHNLEESTYRTAVENCRRGRWIEP